MVTENHQSLARNDQNKIIKPSRKDTQKSSLAGGVANVCKNHQLHVRVLFSDIFPAPGICD
jgi:predicted NodU family carbamoyl transferase